MTTFARRFLRGKEIDDCLRTNQVMSCVPLKLTEPHYMFCGTLGFRGTPVEKHWPTYSSIPIIIRLIWQSYSYFAKTSSTKRSPRGWLSTMT